MKSSQWEIQLGSIKISNNDPFILIAGPCVIDNVKETLYIAETLKKIAQKHKIPLIFKASYDKANRSNINSYRGPGITKGLEILDYVKRKTGVHILTDVHNVSDVKEVSKVADVVQVPAFLSRQTDMITETAKLSKIINIKKGQFLAPEDMLNVIRKAEKSGNKNIILTERGSSFGYHNLVVDMRGIETMKRFGYPVIFDATHSAQLPGALKDMSGGDRDYIMPLARAAAAIGVAGIFMETHPDPKKSKSDSAVVFPLNKLDEALGILKKFDKIAKTL
ncbi:MAG: 3-deoxy-8-phosphooctulonate synthase [Elusimicrobiota bacterium]